MTTRQLFAALVGEAKALGEYLFSAANLAPALGKFDENDLINQNDRGTQLESTESSDTDVEDAIFPGERSDGMNFNWRFKR